MTISTVVQRPASLKEEEQRLRWKAEDEAEERTRQLRWRLRDEARARQQKEGRYTCLAACTSPPGPPGTPVRSAPPGRHGTPPCPSVPACPAPAATESGSATDPGCQASLCAAAPAHGAAARLPAPTCPALPAPGGETTTEPPLCCAAAPAPVAPAAPAPASPSRTAAPAALETFKVVMIPTSGTTLAREHTTNTRAPRTVIANEAEIDEPNAAITRTVGQVFNSNKCRASSHTSSSLEDSINSLPTTGPAVLLSEAGDNEETLSVASSNIAGSWKQYPHQEGSINQSVGPLTGQSVVGFISSDSAPAAPQQNSLEYPAFACNKCSDEARIVPTAAPPPIVATSTTTGARAATTPGTTTATSRKSMLHTTAAIMSAAALKPPRSSSLSNNVSIYDEQ